MEPSRTPLGTSASVLDAGRKETSQSETPEGCTVLVWAPGVNTDHGHGATVGKDHMERALAEDLKVPGEQPYFISTNLSKKVTFPLKCTKCC